MRPFELTVTRARNHGAPEVSLLTGTTRHATSEELLAAVHGALARWGKFTDDGKAFLEATGGDLTLGDVLAHDLLEPGPRSAPSSLATLLAAAGISIANDTATLAVTADYDHRVIRSEAAVIPATLKNDSTQTETEFDAAPWFAQAEAQELQDLVDIEYSGDQAADAVAHWIAGTDPVLLAALETCEHGYEVYVDPVAARQWLTENARSVVFDT